MCNRFRVAKDRFIITIHGKEFVITIGARYNVAPQQKVPIIIPHPLKEFEFKEMTWGLQMPWQNGPQLNAKAETLKEKKTFNSILQNRCLIPMDGFYDFTGPIKERQPIMFTKKGDEMFCVAGLYQTLKTAPEDVEVVEHNFVLLTTTPNKSVARFHNRMPFIIQEQHYGWWTGDGELFQTVLDNPDKDELFTLPVQKILNNVRNEGPQLIRPAPMERELF